jgi:hypothetical protein
VVVIGVRFRPRFPEATISKCPPARRFSKTIELFVHGLLRPTHQLIDPNHGPGYMLGLYRRPTVCPVTRQILLACQSRWLTVVIAMIFRCQPTSSAARRPRTSAVSLLTKRHRDSGNGKFPTRSGKPRNARGLGTVASRAQCIRSATSPSGEPGLDVIASRIDYRISTATDPCIRPSDEQVRVCVSPG